MTEWEQFRQERLRALNQKRNAENEAGFSLKEDPALAKKVIAKILRPVKDGTGYCCPMCDNETGQGVDIAPFMHSGNFRCSNCGEHGTVFLWAAWKNHHPTPQRTDYEEVYYHAAVYLPFLKPYINDYQDTVLLQTT